jgi:hypothetical protein
MIHHDLTSVSLLETYEWKILKPELDIKASWPFQNPPMVMSKIKENINRLKMYIVQHITLEDKERYCAMIV